MKLIISLYLLSFTFGASCQEIKPCPEEFPVEAIKLSSLPQGWTGIYPTKLLLVSADVIVGSPQPAAQIGQHRKTRDGYEVLFDASSSRPTEKWLACRYGLGGHLALAERLPDDTDRCMIGYHRRPAYNDYDIQIACHTASPKPGDTKAAASRHGR
jgi:hypothetical protein